jgi:hypothetical protein
MEIGAADAYMSDTDLDLARTGRNDGRFDETKLALGLKFGDFHDSFLNRLSKAVRASPGVRTSCRWGGEGPGPKDEAGGAPSRMTVTFGVKSSHSFALSLYGIRAGIGFTHWKRVEGSKWEHCLQQCNSVLHFGQLPLKSVPCGSTVEQLKQRDAVTV